MGQLKTERIREQELDFTYQVYVNKEGEFSTTLPLDIVKLFEEASIDLKQNHRTKKEGFFVSDTYQGLKNDIEGIIKEYYSKELIESKTVIRYAIQTTCSYCLDPDGNIAPNGQEYWTKTKEYRWKGGTVKQHAASPRPFGFLVYAEAYQRETLKFKSGKIKIEYRNLGEQQLEQGTYLHWLNSFASISKPRDADVKEIDYTEEAAQFFVELLSSICQLNERIKGFLSPDEITKIIDSKQKLLV